MNFLTNIGKLCDHVKNNDLIRSVFAKNLLILSYWKPTFSNDLINHEISLKKWRKSW